MKLYVRHLLILFTLVSGVAGQFGPIDDIINGIGNTLNNAVNGVVGAFNGFVEFIGELVDTAILGIAEAVIGENPEVLACNGINDALAATDIIECSGCEADVEILAAAIDVGGTCTVADTCVTEELCGGCVADYSAVGALDVVGQTFDGAVTLTGSCSITEGDLAEEVSTFQFSGMVDLDGGLNDLENVAFMVGSCNASLLDSAGATVGTCQCSTEGCAGLEISFSCSNIPEFGGISSDGCVPITEFAGALPN